MSRSFVTPYSWSAIRALGSMLGRGQHFPPGVRLGHQHADRHTPLPQNRCRLRAARNHRHALEGLLESGFAVPRTEHPGQGSRSHTREQDRHVEVAVPQAFEKTVRFRLVADRHLAHRWRDHRFTALVPYQCSDFRRAAALERQHAQAVEGHIRSVLLVSRLFVRAFAQRARGRAPRRALVSKAFWSASKRHDGSRLRSSRLSS